MEPRPQRPRPTPGQPAGGPSPVAGGSSAAGAPATQGFHEGGIADPTQFIAPPRTEYDYSPLDLAPPGQRRRRQLVVGIVGILAVIVIAAAVVFGYILVNGGNDKTTPTPQDQLAAAQTVVAQNAAKTGTPTTGDVAQTNPTATIAASGANGGGAGTDPTKSSTTTGQAGATKSAKKPSPTAPAGPTMANLQKLLPAANLMPQGLDQQEDSSLDEQAVVSALGDSRTAQQNLDKWGWSGNAGVTYTASDPSSLNPGSVTVMSVSVHGFSTASGAQGALTFFSDTLINGDPSWTEATDPKLGNKSRMLTSTDASGVTTVQLYIQKGRVVYKIYGSANGGDPTQVVVQLATTLLGG